jgi:ABC-2 type transport system permease protein
VNVPRVIAIGWLMHLKMLTRSWFNGLLGVIWPMFFSTSAFLMYGAGDRRHLAAVAVGASMIGIWSATSTSGAGSMQHLRREGTLELLAAAPVPFPASLAPVTLAMSTVGLYSMAATVIWARLLFGIPLTVGQPAGFIGGVAVTVTSVGMFGFLLSVCVVRFRSAWALGNMLEFPLWLICGFMIPLSLLPGWVRPISFILGPTWGVRAVHEAATGGSAWGAMLMALALSAVYGVIGVWVSGRVLRSARANATLALS